jgi:hypothetical protein
MEKLTLKIFKKLLLLVGFQFCVVQLFAQAKTSATASATILHPVSTGKLEDLYLGNFQSPKEAGTIILTSKKLTTATGGMKLKIKNASAETAVFEISHSNYAFSITSSKDCIKLKSNSGNEMMELELTHYELPDPSGNNTLKSIIRVGGTLHVGSQQAPGEYLENEDLYFAINYN